MKRKKLNAALLISSLFICNPVSTFANNGEDESIATHGAVCEFTRGYSEKISNKYNVEQFSHIADKNSVVTDVTLNVTVTGQTTLIDSDCSSKQETTTVKDSLETYHTSVKL